MGDYDSIEEFNEGWAFFTKKIDYTPEQQLTGISSENQSADIAPGKCVKG